MGSGGNAPVGLTIIGAQVRSLRERRGITQGVLADRIGYSASLVRMIERGERLPRPEFLERLEGVLEVPGLFTSVRDQLLRDRHPAWFQPYAELEAEAVALSAYDNQLVRGLLQTEAYARAVHTAYRPTLDEEEIERRIATRMARQRLLSRRPAPALSFVIEEVVLRRPVGGLEVLRDQLQHLLRCAEMRHIELQIMPTDRENHAGLEGPFTLIEPPDREMCAYIESQDHGSLISDRQQVGRIARRYGILRGQALSPEESAIFIHELVAGAP
ncbi:helix-turn-helix domain-containing protein [Streptomyces meridianus]|uniref:Helix-turn-helix transcriptional regulator n=1 Tax=Streptomyces meridianus TaxID=2938945 RepID=A0ABT0X861_9ACTN|nr:helix-turn-helix transcriptional regulator [Streptomyces meridianus]MCM2577969.1 helix-turn-helix transcriptional regulator [Streptomyces meridianus]